jgi:hypothetical protein
MAPGGTTGYAGNQTIYTAYHGAFASEDSAKVDFPKCRIKRMCIRISTNSIGGTTTINLRKNGANTGDSITIGSGATGHFATNCDVQIEEGDDIDYQWVIGGTGGQGIYPKGGGVYIE